MQVLPIMTRSMNFQHVSKALLAATALTAATVPAFPAHAQSGDAPVSREVVQPLPSPDVQRLNRALKRLATNSRDLGALIDAGNAALALNDLDASMGFFGRAQELSPSNADAKMGMAAIFLRSERPVEALRLFSEAEKSGASPSAVLPERGLAYDLVGNGYEAQASYRAALARENNDEITRRLALSQAIAGDRAGFEATLRPLLDKRDYAAYRTRAFGLAILGDAKEARAITDAVMPKDLASRIAPYLDYMPRLTKAQQAAAANLGIFPRAAQIGRDDPRIAQYASSTAPAAAQAGDKLAPQGAPLGNPKPIRLKNTNSKSAAKSKGKADNRVKVAAATRVEAMPPAQSGSRLAAVAREQSLTPPPPQPMQQAASAEVVTVVAAPPASAPTEAVRPAVSTFDLAQVSSGELPPVASSASSLPAAPQQMAQMTQRSEAVPTVQSVPEPAPSVADAFADFTAGPTTRTNAGTGAVDITAIKVPREKPPEPPKPEKPTHPSRIWVQVATGKELSALKFDWRRFSRQAPELLGDFKPHVTAWGQANRLLAGPVASDAAARDLVKALKAKDLDAFTFTSPEGQEITILQ